MVESSAVRNSAYPWCRLNTLAARIVCRCRHCGPAFLSHVSAHAGGRILPLEIGGGDKWRWSWMRRARRSGMGEEPPPLLPSCPCVYSCLLYTSDAADERSSVDLGGRRIIKKKKKK